MVSEKSYAKVNIFLKITGYKDGYHTISSRFVKVRNLFDTITFVPQKCKTFTIDGCDDVPRDSNTIFKAFKKLNEETGNLDILEFFYNHKVVVRKNIPSCAGLGGGSSNAGTFLRMTNEICNLNLSPEHLASIGSRIGADVPFFVFNYDSADVSGFGEMVAKRNEKHIDLDIYTPPLSCDTGRVFSEFRKTLLPSLSVEDDLISSLSSMDSASILDQYNDIYLLNDLYAAAEKVCPDLSVYAREGWFFSGSGSSFFTPA